MITDLTDFVERTGPAALKICFFLLAMAVLGYQRVDRVAWRSKGGSHIRIGRSSMEVSLRCRHHVVKRVIHSYLLFRFETMSLHRDLSLESRSNLL